MTPEDPDPRYETVVFPYLYDVVVTDSPAAFLDSWNSVSEPLGILLAAVLAQCEVLNGGLAQFFSNSSGVMAPEAVRGFQALGQPKAAETMHKAMARFGRVYPRDRSERQRIFPESVHHAFDDLDDELVDQLYSENGGFIAASDAYIERFGIRPPDDRS